MLVKSGVATEADKHALGVLCEAYSRWQFGREHDEAAFARGAREDFIKLLKEFGLTPASRSGIKVDVKPVDELTEFLTRKID